MGLFKSKNNWTAQERALAEKALTKRISKKTDEIPDI